MNWLKLKSGTWVNLALVRTVTPNPMDNQDLLLTFGDGSTETYLAFSDIAVLRARLDRLSGEQTETDQRYRAAHWQHMSEAAR